MRRNAAVAVMVLMTFAACHHSHKSYAPVVNPEFANLTKEQIFAKGEELFNRKRWQRARSYFSNVYENYPNDPLGRRALLRVADTYFQQGDPVNLVEAQYKYRDFINRYPTSDKADYAMLQIAMVSFKQMERPDRDQQKTHEAVDKFNEMLKAYPKSPLRPEAEARLQDALDRLAKHEQTVARYYMRRGAWPAALQRLNYILDNYANYREKDAVFFDLGTTLTHLGRGNEAKLYYERVISEFPKSDYAARAKRQLGDTKA